VAEIRNDIVFDVHCDVCQEETVEVDMRAWLDTKYAIVCPTCDAMLGGDEETDATGEP
jgi:endogenous inhibitor of DNA gyrase (YacG/DUF329 family)